MIVEIAKSLAARGITNVVINLVESATILPYLVKQMTEKCDVVLAVGLLNSEERNLTDILTESLITTGMTQSCPVVPALISPASLLELKASLHLSCPKWASSVNSLVALETVAPIAFSSLEVSDVIRHVKRHLQHVIEVLFSFATCKIFAPIFYLLDY